MLMDKENITEWVNNHTEEMYGWALSRVADPEVAKDLVQDTFLAAAERYAIFKGKSSPKTWLFSILNNKIADLYRVRMMHLSNIEERVVTKYFDENGEWKESKVPHSWHDNDTHLLDNLEFQQILKKCLEALPEKWNLCIKMKYLSEMDGDEICNELNLSISNYWQIAHRAKLQLRNCVDTKWFKD